jgi:hypothetical protein
MPDRIDFLTRPTVADALRIGTRAQVRGSVVLVAWLLCASAATAGCGRAPGVSARPVSTESVPAAVRAETIQWFFPATMAQSDGGAAFLQALHGLSVQAVNTCLKQRRLGRRQAAYLRDLETFDLNPYRTLPGYVQQWAGALINIRQVAASGMLVPVIVGANRKPSESGHAAAQAQAAAADLTRCAHEVDAPLERFQQYGWPLQSQWQSLTQGVYQSAAETGALRAFGSCALADGAPSTAIGSPEQVRVWLSTVVDPPSARTSAPPAASPRAALDLRWSRVWARCAGPVMTVREHQLLAAQQRFLRAHEAQLSRLEHVVATSVRAVRLMIGG